MAGARAGHGHDDRAGHLYSCGRARGAEAFPQHRRAHRRRCRGHQEWRRGAHGACSQGPRGDRSSHGGRVARMSERAVAAADVDIAIVGGGLVGASLALGLSDTGVRVLLLEGTAPASSSQPSFDERTTALGNASRRIFQALGVWERLAPEAAAIRAIHVSDAGRFGFARLSAGEQGIEAFGYVVPNRVIGPALWETLQDSAV